LTPIDRGTTMARRMTPRPPLVRPRALRPGDVLGIVAPAGPVADRSGVEAGAARLERLGFRVRYEERIFQSHRYLAGDDGARAEELMRCFEDPGVAGILALRGGYGSARLLSRIDPARLRGREKVFMGFSDLTTLHLYFRRTFGWVTFHGPMATSPFLYSLSGEEERHLVSLLTDPEYRPRLSFEGVEAWSGGVAEGPLIGGCLSLVVASLGTPYEIQTEGCILLLEDLGEPPYRLDRMLTHLRLAGKLEGLAGILLGSFEGSQSEDASYTADDVLKEALLPLGIPVLAHLPCGHGPRNWPLPLNLPVHIDAAARTLELPGPAVVSSSPNR
jgi:muramoyltetrapeptide carboxypeptidase